MIRNNSSFIHNLEVQMGQLVNSLVIRNQGALPSNTGKNPKEQVKAITMRRGTEIQTPKVIMEYKENKNAGEKEHDDGVQGHPALQNHGTRPREFLVTQLRM